MTMVAAPIGGGTYRSDPTDILIELGISIDDIVTWRTGGSEIVSVPTLITPEMAQSWLNQRNPSVATDPDGGNRKLSARATVYAEEMRRGLWRVSPQNVIAFDEHGILLDGQHRLRAIVLAGGPIEFLVQAGWPRSSFAIIDTALGRRAVQFTPGKYAVDRHAAARILAAVSGMASAHDVVSARPMNNDEERTWLTAWPELDSLAAPASKCYDATRISKSMHMAVLAMAMRTPSAHLIDSWLAGVTAGDALAITDPRLHLRNRWIRDSRALVASGSNRAIGYLTIVKMWNAYANGQQVNQLKASMSEAIPAVAGFTRTRQGAQVRNIRGVTP